MKTTKIKNFCPFKFSKIESKKRGQIWIETVIYTLIALIMIGTVLSFVQPKIQEIQDKAVIDQSLKVITKIDSEINSVVQRGSGNKEIMSFELKKGEIEINCPVSSGSIKYILKDTRNIYSEQCTYQTESECIYNDKQTNYGNVKLLTIKRGKLNDVILSVTYDSGYDTYANLICDNNKLTFSKSTTPYKISIFNEGSSSGDVPSVKIEKIG